MYMYKVAPQGWANADLCLINKANKVYKILGTYLHIFTNNVFFQRIMIFFFKIIFGEVISFTHYIKSQDDTCLCLINKANKIYKILTIYTFFSKNYDFFKDYFWKSNIIYTYY